MREYCTYGSVRGSDIPSQVRILERSVELSTRLKGMFLTEYDQEKVLAQERREVEFMTNKRVATDMLRDGKPLDEIKRYSRLAEDAIRRLAGTLGLTVV